MKHYTPETFLEAVKDRQPKRWDYTKTKFVNVMTHVTVTCPAHGDFTQEAASLLKGYVGCSSCSGIVKTSEDFVREVRDIWGDRWDLSQTIYVNATTRVSLNCREHGEFHQFPSAVTSKKIGCKPCAARVRKASKQKEFIRRAQSIHADRWRYTEVRYDDSRTKVTITCPQHGNFQQLPSEHLRPTPTPCPNCRAEEQRVVRQEKFLELLEDTYPDKTHEGLQYSDSHTAIQLRCEEHGTYTQLPYDYLRGHLGCTRCNRKSSRAEEHLLQFVSSLGLEPESHKRGLLGNTNQEIDIYIPSAQVGLEFNGVYYHSELFMEKDYHFRKYQAAKDAGIRLIQIWEDDWLNRPEVVKEHIRQVTGTSQLPKVSARTTTIVKVSPSDAESFLNKYHIQGAVKGAFYLGLKGSEDLVALAAFRWQGDELHLVRYATSASVRGGHSKLVTHVERNFSYQNLTTFADLTFSNGNLYRQTGWVEGETLPPDYTYLRSGKRYHKFNYRLKRFREDPTLTFEEGLTEAQLAKKNKLWRVYDAGKIRFTKNHPDRNRYGK